MIAKFAILLFASACLAYPADEEATPPQAIPSPQGIPPPQNIPAPQSIVPPQDIVPPQSIVPPQGIPVPFPEGQQPEGQLQDGPAPPQGPAGSQLENSDLKTDSTFWFRKRYYPIYRSYYRPRAYTYSYYPTYYSYYWSPYSWW